ncbi:hypothetical protein ACU8KH_03448 [Lachancea thermotolerans]
MLCGVEQREGIRPPAKDLETKPQQQNSVVTRMNKSRLFVCNHIRRNLLGATKLRFLG